MDEEIDDMLKATGSGPVMPGEARVVRSPLRVHDVKDFKKGMHVAIIGGADVWKVAEDAIDDDVLLVNPCGVVIDCDYARLEILPGNGPWRNFRITADFFEDLKEQSRNGRERIAALESEVRRLEQCLVEYPDHRAADFDLLKAENSRLAAENERLKEALTGKLSEDDAGNEFTYVMVLKEKVSHLTALLAKAEGQLSAAQESLCIISCPPGEHRPLCTGLSQALAEIRGGVHG